MIDASRSVDKPTENVRVPFDEYKKLSSISTKVDIIVDLMCHGMLMADDVLRILKVDTNFPKETTFERDIVVSVCIYNNLLELKERLCINRQDFKNTWHRVGYRRSRQTGKGAK